MSRCIETFVNIITFNFCRW